MPVIKRLRYPRGIIFDIQAVADNVNVSILGKQHEYRVEPSVVLEMQQEGHPPVITVSKEIMKILLGGEFPEDPNGFQFDVVGQWAVAGNGLLVPGGDLENPAPGPDFQLTMVPFM